MDGGTDAPHDTADIFQATEYLIDPLNAPQPSEEDGPGTSFRPQAQPPTPTSPITKSSSVRSSGSRLTKNNPYRQSLGSPPAAQGVARSSSLKSPSANTYPSPPPSASPRSLNYRVDALGVPTNTHRRRGSSLNEKYPGDMSHRPLDTLTKEKHRADRARQTSRKHHIPPDTIDSLDRVGGAAYHHGGPYDATLFARNNSSSGPLGALQASNAETLRATPREKVIDSVRGHRPLDGIATYAPGETDRNGHTYTYVEGENMMIDANPAGGAYKRWPGVQYHPDDIKGKGEPSYSIEKALKEHGGDEKKGAGAYRDQPEQSGMEMKTHSHSHPHSHSQSQSQSQSRHASGNSALSGVFDDGEGATGTGVRRSGSLSTGLKKRWGSVKRHMHRDSE